MLTAGECSTDLKCNKIDCEAWYRAGTKISEVVEKNYPHFESIYQGFHKYPELAHKEKETSIKLANELSNLGFRVVQNFAGYGVVAILENGEGPTALIRTELDALPIHEETDVPYQSLINGAMHACGHDVHMTILLGTAKVLTELEDSWSGTIIMIGQPAEETGEGAKAMIDKGLFELFPKPDYALSLHVSASKPVGSLTYKKGYSLANVDYVDVIMKGTGGHGAIPEASINPIELAAQFALKLKSFVSEINKTDRAVVSIGLFQSGTGYNIIPTKTHLQMTSRSYKEDVRLNLEREIHAIAEGIAKDAGAPKPEVDYRRGVPSLYNDPQLVDELIPVFINVVGKDNVFETKPKMFGDDFGYYGYKTNIPIFQFGLGVQDPEEKPWPRAHSPQFAPQFKEAFKIGVMAMAQSVIKLQSRK